MKAQSIISEQSVLGALMLDNSALSRISNLKSTDFNASEHRLIFQAIEELNALNQPFDMVTLSEHLEQSGKYAGGIAYLGILVESTPSAANIHAYAQIVLQHSLNRQVKALLEAKEIDYTKLKALSEQAIMPNVKAGKVQIKQFSDLEGLEFAGIKWVVDGLIPEGTRNLLAAKPKAGKSWLALSLAHAVATGGDFLGRKTTRGNVLYLALEDNDRRMKNRINALNMGFSKGISYATAGNFPAADAGGIEALAQWCKSVEHPALIIIDTFAKFRPQANSASSSMYQSDYESTQGLLQIAETFGAAIMLIHHTRKMQSDDPLETVSGSLGLIGGLDNLFVLERGRNSKLGKLSLIGRDLESDEPINLLFENCAWRAMSDAETLLTPDRARLALMILDGYAIKEMAGILEKNEGAIYKMLHDMVKAGIIYRKGRGEYLLCSDIERPYLERVSNGSDIEDFKASSLPSLPQSYHESYHCF